MNKRELDLLIKSAGEDAFSNPQPKKARYTPRIETEFLYLSTSRPVKSNRPNGRYSNRRRKCVPPITETLDPESFYVNVVFGNALSSFSLTSHRN